MTENERKDYVCDLLDNLKEGVRWMDSIETIFNAVGITCKAIEPDPLLGFNLHLLFCHLQDKDLVAWWLTPVTTRFCMSIRGPERNSRCLTRRICTIWIR